MQKQYYLFIPFLAVFVFCSTVFATNSPKQLKHSSIRVPSQYFSTCQEANIHLQAEYAGITFPDNENDSNIILQEPTHFIGTEDLPLQWNKNNNQYGKIFLTNTSTQKKQLLQNNAYTVTFDFYMHYVDKKNNKKGVLTQLGGFHTSWNNNRLEVLDLLFYKLLPVINSDEGVLVITVINKTTKKEICSFKMLITKGE